MCQDGRCQKCSKLADVHVTMGFAPGGAETLHLCSYHALDMYLAVTRWFSGQQHHRRKGDQPRWLGGQSHCGGKGEDAVPTYAKAAW